MRIALDAMGGDRAPGVTVRGALDAVRDLSVEVVLVGQEGVVRRELAAAGGELEIVHAPDVIGMDEHPAAAVRRKKESSIVVGMRLVKERKADVFLSAGNSGAVMAAALVVLGRCTGTDRPAIGSPIPTRRGSTLLLDSGAITDPRPENLLEWAWMGSIYMGALRHDGEASVGLLSNGEESTKGDALTLKAHELLRASGLNFYGNVEGSDILRGTVDVVVTDGFTGNIALKSIEGTAEVISGILREEVTRGVRNKLAALVLRPAFARVRKRLDYSEVGGAPLLGVNGAVFISHGRSNANAIRNALRVANEAASNDFVGAINRSAAARNADSTG